MKGFLQEVNLFGSKVDPVWFYSVCECGTTSSNFSCDGREGRETSGGMDVVPGVTVMEEGGRSSRRVEMDEEQDKEEEEGAGRGGGDGYLNTRRSREAAAAAGERLMSESDGVEE